MWWLLAFARAHPSPHGFLSEKYVSTHAVCESYTISASSFVAPAKNDTLSIQVQGSHMVNTQPLNHIDEALLTTPSWLTNNTHTSQADPFFLRPKEVRVMLPDITNNKVMSFSFSKNNPTGAAMDGLHPHKGDSASAINAAMMEYKSELCNEYGYTNAVIDTYNELACYFAFVANEHNNNFGKPRRRKVRKKKKKANPLRAHFRDQNSPRNLTCTTRSARSRTHAKATKSKKMTWVDKLNLPQFVVCSLIGCSSCIALVAGIFCLGLEGTAQIVTGTIGFFYIAVTIAVIVPSVLNFLVRLVREATIATVALATLLMASVATLHLMGFIFAHSGVALRSEINAFRVATADLSPPLPWPSTRWRSRIRSTFCARPSSSGTTPCAAA